MTLRLLLVSFVISQALSQSIYINNVPGYSALPPCAEVPLSLIVRDMVDGCGDGGHITSYSCFCTASSSHYDQVISSSVASSCTADSSPAASSALNVFASYCELGSGLGTCFSLEHPTQEAKIQRQRSWFRPATTTTKNPTLTGSTSIISVSSSSSKYSPVRVTSGPIPSASSAVSQVHCKLLGLMISMVVGLAHLVILWSI